MNDAPFLSTIPKGHKFGTVTGTTAATVLTDLDCQMVMFQAAAANSGVAVYGNSTATITTGISLSAGTMSPWIPCRNLNELYLVMTSTADNIIYHAIT